MFILAHSGDWEPVVLFLAIFVVVGISLYYKNKEKERRHAERLKSLELGAPLPPEPVCTPQPHRGALLGGILSLSLAIAFFFLSKLTFASDSGDARDHLERMVIPAIILGSLGVGFLLYYFLSKRKI